MGAGHKEAWIRFLISKHLIPHKDDLTNIMTSRSTMVIYQMQRILYNFLVSKPESEVVPDILYWLGILESRERNIDLYILGELYLEQCIIKYPKSAIAPECYRSYARAISEGFTGSSGLNIPSDIQRKLKKYKQMIFAK